jgi:hypothetical protein
LANYGKILSASRHAATSQKKHQNGGKHTGRAPKAMHGMEGEIGVALPVVGSSEPAGRTRTEDGKTNVWDKYPDAKKASRRMPFLLDKNPVKPA